jgi:hypothetical protein
MIEKDSITRKKYYRLTIIHRNPVCIELGYPIGAFWDKMG